MVWRKELYFSPNGDRWILAQDGEGKLFVRHQPNLASGGIVSEIPVDVFLAQGGQGPEYQALSAALAKPSNDGADTGQLDAKISEHVDRVLGQAVARCWRHRTRNTRQRCLMRLQSQAFREWTMDMARGQLIRLATILPCHDDDLRQGQSTG